MVTEPIYDDKGNVIGERSYSTDAGGTWSGGVLPTGNNPPPYVPPYVAPSTPVKAGTVSSPATTDPNPYWLKDGETTEQYTNRVLALMRGGASTTPSTEYSGTDPITSTDIQASSEFPYSTSTSRAYTTPQLQMTPYEQQAQTMSEQLQQLNASLLGESAYRTEQEGAQGISTLTKTKQDLTNQINMLAAEAAAIPLQLEMEAKGRGITTGVLQRQENDRLRTNTIAALGASALLSATNGNLTTAYALVDRAVSARFDPIREQIEVRTNNLNLILNSPAANLAEKNRAQAQIDLQNYQKEAINRQSEEEAEIWNIAINAANNGADALTLQKIQKATTKEEALQIAQQAGIYQQQTTDTQEFTRVKQIVASHPGEWGNAADQIDREFGQGTATKYDDYLKSVYQKGNVSSTGNASVDAWVDLLSKGQTQIYNIPTNIRNDVITKAAERGVQILSPTFAKASADAQSSFNSAINQLSTIETNANKVITAQGLGGLLKQGTQSTISKIPYVGAALQPAFKLYNDSVDAFTSMLARAVGEKGMLTDLDIARVKKALPQPTDTAELAKLKLDTFKSLLNSIKNGAVDAYSAQQLGITVKASDVTTGPINASQADLDYIKIILNK